MSPRDTRAGPGNGVSGEDVGVGLRILMAPDYRRDNPYQALLAAALERRGARVAFPRGYRRVLPLSRMLGQDGRRPDILHLHWLAPYLRAQTAAAVAAYALRLLLDVALVRLAGVRLVWTVHNLVEHEQAHPGIELWCRRRLARLADAIVVHSDRARGRVARLYGAPAERISVIPHGNYRDCYGPPIAAARARARLDLPQEGCVFLFLGMIRPYKGVLKILSAWAGTPTLHRHTLAVAGAAPDPRYREAVRRAAAEVPGVRLWLGRVPDDQVGIFVSAADAMIVPAENVLTSGSAVLAESYGKHMIAPQLSPDQRQGGLDAVARAEEEVRDLARLMTRFAGQEAGTARPTEAPPLPPSWDDASRLLLLAARDAGARRGLARTRSGP